MTVNVKVIKFYQELFFEKIKKLLDREQLLETSVLTVVNEIIQAVKKDGDTAVLAYTKQFDQLIINDVSELVLERDQLETYLDRISASEKEALNFAATRIRSFHKKQLGKSVWEYQDEYGNLLGNKITAINKVGMYVPGGKASYPSTVLMNAIPAKVAGVRELIMVVPTPMGNKNNIVFAAAAIAGVDKVICVGGAQAIAALTYGTKSIPAVDKIVGPGNIFVATAKQLLFGQVGIDMIAGPSELLIYADDSNPPEWVVTDLFSQAEHDENAQVILVSKDESYIEVIKETIQRKIEGLPREEIVRESLNNYAAFILVESDQQAIDVINIIAPEHLQLAVDNARDLLTDISNCGAAFIGPYSSESLGDYCAGPSHVLPTSGTARFSSALGVQDFQKRISVIDCTQKGAKPLARVSEQLAKIEGLDSHAASAKYRA